MSFSSSSTSDEQGGLSGEGEGEARRSSYSGSDGVASVGIGTG